MERKQGTSHGGVLFEAGRAARAYGCMETTRTTVSRW